MCRGGLGRDRAGTDLTQLRGASQEEDRHFCNNETGTGAAVLQLRNLGGFQAAPGPAGGYGRLGGWKQASLRNLTPKESSNHSSAGPGSKSLF